MSFIDLLRGSRTGRVPVLHKFLTQYDPNTKRIYAFVEGHADQAFYRIYIEPFADNRRDVSFYNCEGKKNVYAAYGDVVSRYPTCERVLFFVDKDIDDILGNAWPTDPRIFVTDYYSIENYIVRRDCLRRYLEDFVKIKRVDVDLQPALDRFDATANRFHDLVTPIMAWILVMRRGGNRVLLSDVNLATLFIFTNTGLTRRPNRRAMEYLYRVTGTPVRNGIWRQVRAACIELRSMPPRGSCGASLRSGGSLVLLAK